MVNAVSSKQFWDVVFGWGLGVFVGAWDAREAVFGVVVVVGVTVGRGGGGVGIVMVVGFDLVEGGVGAWEAVEFSGIFTGVVGVSKKGKEEPDLVFGGLVGSSGGCGVSMGAEAMGDECIGGLSEKEWCCGVNSHCEMGSLRRWAHSAWY